MKEGNYYFSFDDHPFLDLFESVPCVWDLLKHLSSYLKQKNLGKIASPIAPGVVLENQELIFIAEGVIIEPGAYIKGPAWIGEGCEIRHGAYLRENVLLAPKVVVGHSTEVKNSILLTKAHAAHFNYVGDSILGVDSNLGAGVICANVRLDHKTVLVEIEGTKIDTGLQKMGVILGDHSQIGCNSVINPGTLIGQGVLSPPCLSIRGTIKSHSKIKPLKQYIIEA